MDSEFYNRPYLERKELSDLYAVTLQGVAFRILQGGRQRYSFLLGAPPAGNECESPRRGRFYNKLS